MWTDGDVPAGVDQGVKVTEAYLTRAGIYIINEFTRQGVYFLDNNGAQTVASREQDSFGSTMRWLPLGIVNQEDLLFVPVSINNVYPVYRHGAAGLTAVTEPTPSQSIGQWVDGKMVFTTISGSAGVKVWLYQEGQPDQLLYDEASLPGLNPTLDYDGESVFMSTGKVDVDASVYLRRADGTLKPIIKHGDPLPGSEGTYRGLPTRQGAFVDQGRLYMVAESKETFPFFTDRVLLSSDGDSTEVLLRRGQDVPGLAEAKLDGFEVSQVRNGRVWFVASLSSGGKALYFLENNTWNEVFQPKIRLMDERLSG